MKKNNKEVKKIPAKNYYNSFYISSGNYIIR